MALLGALWSPTLSGGTLPWDPSSRRGISASPSSWGCLCSLFLYLLVSAVSAASAPSTPDSVVLSVPGPPTCQAAAGVPLTEDAIWAALPNIVRGKPSTRVAQHPPRAAHQLTLARLRHRHRPRAAYQYTGLDARVDVSFRMSRMETHARSARASSGCSRRSESRCPVSCLMPTTVTTCHCVRHAGACICWLLTTTTMMKRRRIPARQTAAPCQDSRLPEDDPRSFLEALLQCLNTPCDPSEAEAAATGHDELKEWVSTTLSTWTRPS